MKGKIRKIFSIVMVVTLVLCMNITAFAADSKKATEAVGFYEKDDVLYECTLKAKDISYGFMSPDEDQIELIVEWTGPDNYVYLGYFYSDTVDADFDYYFCILYDNNRKETKTSISYTGLVDALDGATVANLSFTNTKDPGIVKMKWGDRSEEWYKLEPADTIDLLASMEEYIAAIAE